MAKLTPEETERIDTHVTMVVKAMQNGDTKELAELLADKDTKKLIERRDTQMADSIVRSWWKSYTDEHRVFKSFRASVRFVLTMASVHTEALQKQGACITKLSQRIAELEARSLQYAGVFKRDDQKSYVPGMLCTHKGSLWICRAPTMADPGSCGDWQMISRGVR